jgi:neutral amino acid transport system ATP-binding protein
VRDEAFARIFELFPHLEPRRRRRAGSLSGGERQMVAIARALMAEPQLLLLDEPSAGLAPSLVDSLFGQIQEIQRSGITVLLVEQNARRALAMSDRGYVLDLGEAKFEGPGPSLLQDQKVVDLYLGGAAI